LHEDKKYDNNYCRLKRRKINNNKKLNIPMLSKKYHDLGLLDRKENRKAEYKRKILASQDCKSSSHELPN